MDGIFWYGLGVATGMAALPWVQRLADRVRRMLAELELADPLAPRAARATNGPIRRDIPTKQQGRFRLMLSRIAVLGPGQPDSPRPCRAEAASTTS